MTPTTASRRARRGLRRLIVLAAALAVLSTAACSGSPDVKTPVAAPKPALSAAPAVMTGDQYLTNPMDFNGAVDWTGARTVNVDLGDNIKASKMFFAPKDLVLRAGIPYMLKLKNTGVLVHEFTAAQFFRSASVRKIASEEGEVRVPYFTGIKVEPGKTVTVFAIPVIPGQFDIFCSIPGHREAGMEGGITVTGSRPEVPVPVLGSLKSGKWLQDSPAIIKAAEKTWDAKAKTIQFEAGDSREGAQSMYFAPKQLVLKKDQPYIIQLVNTGTILHEYTADDFFPTVAFVKAKDASGEYTSPLLKEAEVLAKKRLDLYLIPTKTGTFKIACKLPGHEEAGMVGTVKVTD